MPAEGDQLARRTELAHRAIRESLGTEAGEYGADLFVSHHLEELDPSYWMERVGTDRPEPEQVVGLLIVDPECLEGEEGLDSLDFVLPGDVSNYLLCVQSDDEDKVDEIAMES